MPQTATEILQRLFRVPPPEFVAERNTIAKALKADGEKDLAAAVSAVRRPGVSDWALDVAASEHADDVAELVEAANEVLDAQDAAMEGRDGGDLRIRLKLLRVCAATVVNQASAIAERSGQTGAGSSVTDIATRLTEVAANRNALSLLERGLLGAEDPGVADPFGIAGVTAAPAAKATPAAKAKAAPAEPEAPPTPAGPSEAELKKLKAAVADAKKAVSAAEATSTAADKALAKQEASVAKAEARVADAEQLLETRRDEVRAAKAELDDLWDRRDTAASDVSRAQAELDLAEEALAG